MISLEKKWKGLLHKVGYLKSELDERKEKLSKFESEIDGKIQEKDPDVSAPRDPAEAPEAEKKVSADAVDALEDGPGEKHESTDQQQDKDEVEQPPQARKIEAFKKIWKQIALLTHPDRNGGDADLTKSYMSALKAWNDGEVEALLDVAADLSIKIQDPSQEMIDALEDRATQIEDEIKKHESNMLWAWGHAPQDKQTLIVDELLRYKRKKRSAR